MRKILTPFVAALLLLLTLAPLTARAQLNEYFTISGASGLQVKFVGSPNVDLQYSTNKSNWTPISGSNETIAIGNGTYYFKGDNPNGFSKDASNYVQFITSLGTLQGNIMSLINSSTFSTDYSTIPGAYCFYKLFQGCDISSASALKLPATTLADYCYAYMFSNCTSLTTYVELPASIAKDYCYYYMFYDCYQLYTYNSGYADQYNTNRYILPLEELAPHCCERMFSWETGGGENATMRHKNVEIMAASLKDRKNTEITNCLAYMFKYAGSTSTSNYFIFYTTLHFTEWGGTGTAAATYDWWGGAYGTIGGRIKFYINDALPHVTSNKATTNNSSTVATNFPKNNTINTQTNAYLTFKVNGGTWKSDGTYQQDIKRFVSSYYTAKTIPADPYKAGYTFSGWYTAADGGTEVSTATILSQTTSQTYFAHYVLAASSTLTITTPEHGTLVVTDDGDNTISSGASIASGTTLTLTATPAAGYRIKGYTGDATSSSFTMPGENATIGVEFEEDLCSVTIASPSDGTLTASDGTNNYTSGNTYQFNRQTDAGKVLTFTATPASHHTFSSWTDASSLLTNKTSNPYTAKLTIGNSSPLTYTVGASFALAQYTITTSATNGTVTGGGTYDYGTVINLVPLGASHYAFLKWSDDNTDNPRSVTVTGNASYTAVFEFNPSSVSSADAAATIYQAGTGAGGKKILYALDPVTVGGITYTPIDLGYGVAWADRNIGATNITDAGGYFYYGGTTPIYPGTAGSSSTYYSGVSSMSANDNLPMSADAAYRILGTNWRIPTSTEWNQLLNNGAYNNTTLSANFTAAQASRTGNGIITSKTDPTKSITLPGVGHIRDYKYTNVPNYMCYWSSTLAVTGSSTAIPYHLYIYNGKTLASGTGNAVAWHSLPIRAIYSPNYPICTLTIISGAYTYVYLCEIGQKVTITATPNDGYVFNKWSEDNNTNAIRTFTVMEDATYTATFTSAPTYTLAWSSNGSTPTGGTAAGSYIAGTTITAPTTSKDGYTVSKWRDETNGVDFNGTMPGNNVTYTAQWTANTYYVSFAANGGSGTMTDQTFTYGTAQNLKANTFTGPAVTVTYDYNDATGGDSPASETVNGTFYMWMDDSGENFFEDKENVTNLTTTNDATVELTAIWDYNQTVTLPSPTKTGYTLVQWEYGEAPFIVIAGEAGDEFTPDENVTLTAHWNAITYNLTYEGLNGATNSNPASYTVESEFDFAAPGTREGWTFTGWTCGGEAITSIAPGTTGDKTITANWAKVLETFDLEDDHAEGDAYYTTFSSKVTAGERLNIRYVRNFTAGVWATFSLPFGYSFNKEGNNTFKGQVYYLISAEYTKADGYLTLNCMPNTTGIVANKPYVLIPDNDISNPVFNNVALKSIGDGTYSVSNMAGAGEDISFINTQVRGYLPRDKRVIYFSGTSANKLYYSNESKDTKIRAFRGYFYLDIDTDDIHYLPQRVRLVMPNGETIEQTMDEVEGTAAETRKYMENGILVIERNGVKYDAQGHVIK